MNKSAHFIWVSKNNSQNTKWNQFTKVEVVFSIALKSSSKKKLLSRHELQSVWISHSWRKEKLGIELNKEYGMWEQSACCSRKHVVISIHSPTSNFAVFNCTQKLPSSNPSSRPLLHRPPNSFALYPKFFFIGEVRALRLSFSWDLASSTPAGPSTPIQALNRTRLHTKSNFSVSSSSKNSFRAHEGTKICLLRKVHLPRLMFRWRGFDSKGHTLREGQIDRQGRDRERERQRRLPGPLALVRLLWLVPVRKATTDCADASPCSPSSSSPLLLLPPSAFSLPPFGSQTPSPSPHYRM